MLMTAVNQELVCPNGHVVPTDPMYRPDTRHYLCPLCLSAGDPQPIRPLPVQFQPQSGPEAAFTPDMALVLAGIEQEPSAPDQPELEEIVPPEEPAETEAAEEVDTSLTPTAGDLAKEIKVPIKTLLASFLEAGHNIPTSKSIVSAPVAAWCRENAESLRG